MPMKSCSKIAVGSSFAARKGKFPPHAQAAKANNIPYNKSSKSIND
jgi:hypothetical protein